VPFSTAFLVKKCVIGIVRGNETDIVIRVVRACSVTSAHFSGAVFSRW